MRNIKFIVAFFCLLGSISFFTVTIGFADTSDPDGFRGIKWGTKIKKLSDMSPCQPSNAWKIDYVFGRGDNPYPRSEIDVTTYLRKNDPLIIGQVPLDRIEYAFWQGKLIGVEIVYDRKYSKLMDSQFRTMFGDYDTPIVLARSCTKTLFFTGISPQCISNDQQTTVFMMSPSLTEERDRQIKNEEQQKIEWQRQNLKRQF